MTISYAGIGRREPTQEQQGLIPKIARYLAQKTCALRTGAALGADQLFVAGALEARGRVHLCLPWSKYERSWVRTVGEQFGATLVHVESLGNEDYEAFQSVLDHHPVGADLSSGARRMHARNYRILVPEEGPRVDFVVAFPHPKGGGTAQGMRVARALNIPVVDGTKLPEDHVWKVLEHLTTSIW